MKVRGLVASVASLRGHQINYCAPNDLLGALPDKGDLMHDPAMDEELERLLAQVPGLVNSVTASPEASCLPSRTPPRVGSPWRPLHHSRKVDGESDGSTEETDESET
ncbi:UPF0705 protein C11orf49 [Plecturocebus cupreus]